MATERLLVVSPFEQYQAGEHITGRAEIERVAAEYPDFVVRSRVNEPTKAEVKAAGKPADTVVREAVGLPPGPVSGPDTAA